MKREPDPGRPGFHKIDEMVTLVSKNGYRLTLRELYAAPTLAA